MLHTGFTAPHSLASIASAFAASTRSRMPSLSNDRTKSIAASPSPLS